MVINRTVRRVALVAGALAVAVLAAAFNDLRERDPDLPEDVVIVAPSSTSATGAGGAAGPGPQPSETAPAVTPTPSPQSGGLRLPDLALTFRVLLSEIDGAGVETIYRAAVTARDAGEYGIATALFDRVAQIEDDPLAPFAAFRAAQMSALAGDPQSASRYRTLLSEDGAAEALPASIRTIALSEAAITFEEDGQRDEAIATLERLRLSASSSFTVAEAAYDQARLLREAGDPAWVDRAIAAMTAQPSATGAQQALDLLDEDGASYPEMVAAFIEYRARRNGASETRYRTLIDSNTLTAAEAATAWFYVGAILERYFDREGALEAYANSLALDPSGPLADDARYWRGRVFEELGRVGEAATEYDLLVGDFPGSDFAQDGRLRAAVAFGFAGEGAIATARLAEIARPDSGASTATAAEAARWHEILVERFDAPSAGDLSPSLFDPTSYAAVFEVSGDAVTGPIPATAADEAATPIPVDRAAIDAWLAVEAGARPAVPYPVLEDPTVLLAWRLTSAGEAGVARGLLTESMFARRSQPWELVDLAEEAQANGLHDVALGAARLVLGRLSPQEYLDAPRSLLALAYPVGYPEEVATAADEFGVPPLLLLALVRQESAFNPEAGSSAGAFGLTQVIFDTGAAIASDLGVTGWAFADMADPATALRFGAYYLSEQLDSFDGHLLAALSAYNGGPGNAARWLDAQPFGGPDGYVYAVDFTETKLYLELVTENYAMYRYIYGQSEGPRLPHGE